MIALEVQNELLYASLTLRKRNKAITIDHLIVDTGASRSLISIDLVDELGIHCENVNFCHRTWGVSGPIISFQQSVDVLDFGPARFYDFPLDFTSTEGYNGLIGLDLLFAVEAILDLKHHLLLFSR